MSKDKIEVNMNVYDIPILVEELEKANKEIKRLNNDIKVLLKENENKEKVIIAQDNIIKEVREYVSKIIIDETYTKCILEILDKEKE